MGILRDTVRRILIQSLHFFRSRNYEVFLFGHLLLVFVFVVGAWYHLKIIGTERNYMYAAVTLWSFDRAMRILRIFWSGVTSKAEVSIHEGNVIRFKIHFSKRWRYYPGCFAFVYVLRANRFWQSHPFSLTESVDEHDGSLIVHARIRNGITKGTSDYLCQFEDGAATLPVFVEGPYGGMHAVYKYDTVVFIAGGIGVTGTYSYASHLRKIVNDSQRIIFIWCIADEHPLKWFAAEVENLEADPRFDVRIFISRCHTTTPARPTSMDDANSQIGPGEVVLDSKEGNCSVEGFAVRRATPDLKKIVHEEIATAPGTLAILCCGPGRLNDDVRWAVSQSLEASSSRVDYFEESFSW
jgi:predicted ferric reductase